MIPSDVNLTGYEQLLAQFKRLAEFSDDAETENKLLDRAKQLRNDIRKNAPRSNKWSGSADIKLSLIHI